jgi:hypothetical protein
MTDQLVAKAHPHKMFFVEMFTRDVSIEDCILDLIDNSIDGLIRTRELELGQNLLTPPPDEIASNLPIVNLEVSDKKVLITDNCGGIPLKDAQEEVFNFGHSPTYDTEGKKVRLGVYGVGMKRALFKIGTAFEVTSKTVNDGFIVKVDLNEWMAQDSLRQWTFPLMPIDKAKSIQTAGTTIKISPLRENARVAINDGRFKSRVLTEVGRAYALFLERFVTVQFASEKIKPMQIPFGASKEITPAFKELNCDGVTIHLFASLAKRDARNEWPAEQAGWYVACNGRLVVAADKTDLTGWGVSLPEFHTGKYRGFVGLALFSSDDPLKLPWTTKKSGLNRESLVFQRVRHEMVAVSRPIISFLNKMYPSDVPEELQQRALADAVEFVDVRSIAKGTQTSFDVHPQKPTKEKTTVRIQFNAEKDDVEKVRKHLRRPGMSYKEVGEIAFREYLRINKLS